MYDVSIYIAGPLSLWQGKPHPREIIARRSSRWRWLAIARGQSVLAAADSGRCGYVVTKDGKVIHHERARDEECNPPPDEGGGVLPIELRDALDAASAGFEPAASPMREL